MTFRVLFTLDYEIHGNGEGSPRALMVEPTERMLAQFDRFGARLTIMADVAEILRFRRHQDETGRDDFAYQDICGQLRQAVRTGHDVQLHLHPSYERSRLVDGRLQQCFEDYDLARLPQDRLDRMVAEGRSFLETTLQEVDPSYRCFAFRAANWSMNPARAIVTALLKNGITIDTSVFKYGKRDGLVHFDYSSAESELVPWPASADDVCRRDPTSPLREFPIYCEEQPLWRFVTANRLFRAAQGALHPMPRDDLPAAPAAVAPSGGRLRRLRELVLSRHAWKLDFNQCSGAQLIAALERIQRRYDGTGGDLPVVLIGHSKIYTRFNERSLEPFLRYVARSGGRFAFGTFGDFQSADLRATA